MRLIFMGTPQFAVPTLRLLLKSGHEVVGVVTKPDRPKGRGRHVSPPPVKIEAVKHGLPVLQPADLKDSKFLTDLKNFRAECFVVVAFVILPPEVFKMPPRGTVNLHASLLPKYRGAAPIQWAIINGEKETGLTTFYIEEKVDTGKILFQERVKIGKEETAGQLHDRLAEIGAGLLLKTLDAIEEGRARPIQQRGIPTRAPKIEKDDCRIDWNMSCEKVVNLIRGLSPTPGAFTDWEGKRLKIIRARAVDVRERLSEVPGSVVEISDEGIAVAAGKGVVLITELQLQGRKRLGVREFLLGKKIDPGTRFD